MRQFKKNIYKTNVNTNVIPLNPFDYMVITYHYPVTSGPDLDSATTFQNVNMTQDSRYVGCGQNSGYVTPSGNTQFPNTSDINNSYLWQAGDDVSNSRGESIIVNFKNLALSGGSLNDDVRVELYAGWCQHTGTTFTASVSATTYIGGTFSIVDNVINSSGTVVDVFDYNNFNVIMGCCGANPVTSKTHVGTIYYNLVTEIASAVFY